MRLSAPSRPCRAVIAALVLSLAAVRPCGAGGVTICTQNLWNYGVAEDVQRLRRSETSLRKVRSDLERQERGLLARLEECDVVALQEIVGDREASAGRALDRLARLLAERTGHRYETRLADTGDVIRNGFLVRTDGAWVIEGFAGNHSGDRLPALRGFPRVAWDRGPAEIVLEMRAGRADRAAGSAERAGEGERPAEAAPGGTDERGAALAPPVRLRVIDAHLKSKIEKEWAPDRHRERWERVRVIQARALLDLARRRLTENPDELVLVVGDLNSGRGSAARAVLSGRIDPASLLTPRDCIDPEGAVACDLPRGPAVLTDLAENDPDLRGRGSYRFDGREELIDGIFASEGAARLARAPGAAAGDYDVKLQGRIGEGSDHKMILVRLRF